MRKHIQYLLALELLGHSVRFDRIDDGTISVSSNGYKCADLSAVTAELLKLGCRYDFDRGIEEFDKVCGRTFTYLKEPKE